MDEISLIVLKGGQAEEISQLVERVKWHGRKGSSSRTLYATLIDDERYQHPPSEIEVEQE